MLTTILLTFIGSTLGTLFGLYVYEKIDGKREIGKSTKGWY